jgi:hypothetical protein
VANLIDRNRNLDQLYRDQGDGSFAGQMASLSYVWDATNTVWIKLTGDSATGSLNVNPQNTRTLLSASFSLNATGTIVNAVSTKRIKVFAIILDSTTAGSCNLRDGASTALEGSMTFAINGGYVRTVDPPNFLYGTTAGNSLDLVVSSGAFAGSVSYWATDSA